MKLKGKTIGYALTGSHCTLDDSLVALQSVVREGASVVPILSASVVSTDTRFGTAAQWSRRVEEITGMAPLASIVEIEPLGPARILDALVIAPCTGNTLAKLARAINDSSVTMAAKTTIRNGRPVVLAISTNDGLGMNAGNIGLLLNAKSIYFVPFGQDNPQAKPNSLVAHLELLVPSLEAALEGRQIQPILQPWPAA